MFLKIIREVLGRVIIFFDFMTRPRKMKRTDNDQITAINKSKNYSLYQFYACPFCVKTRRSIHHLNIPFVYRDAQKDEQFRNELLNGGGKVKVPCLRIEDDGEVQWLYESKAIIAHLKDEFTTV